MVKIYAPNNTYNGISANIRFENGIAETDNKYIIGWFKAHGYKVEETKAKTEETAEQPKPKAKKKG